MARWREDVLPEKQSEGCWGGLHRGTHIDFPSLTSTFSNRVAPLGASQPLRGLEMPFCTWRANGISPVCSSARAACFMVLPRVGSLWGEHVLETWPGHAVPFPVITWGQQVAESNTEQTDSEGGCFQTVLVSSVCLLHCSREGRNRGMAGACCGFAWGFAVRQVLYL